MGLNLNQVVVAGQPSNLSNIQTPAKEEELSKQELEYLLNLLKNADLKGYQIEMFYAMVVKLQNQYVAVNK